MLQNSGVIAPQRIEPMAALPYQLHVDHPEGLELWPEAGDGSLLIIYDAPPRRDPTLARSRCGLT
jgi:hypothetical protein